MMLPTAERTPQLLPTHIAGMREKTNPALRAGSYAPAQLGMRLQDRVQRGLILPDKRPGAVLLVPIGDDGLKNAIRIGLLIACVGREGESRVGLRA